ncbi:MAG: hypothetical protein A4S16_08780 [Proteobacteria bacterium SG_bin6]|nr:MAG: hypothetical protein A4S16_08780 [Proteobacteria bacterium SG_bin6]
MTDAEPGADPTLFAKSPGEKLREAREAQGLSLAEIAARTRVPIRHLQAIEAADYAGLPSPTYAVGFAKAYARAVGVDEVVIGREVRGTSESAPRTATPSVPLRRIDYGARDPSRLPPRGLAAALALVAAILLGGVAIWYGTGWFRGDGTAVVTVPEPAPTTRPTPAQAPAPRPVGGQVTLAATDLVWLRVYDASGKTLYEHELKPGERYDVPPEADRPMINVGRPDKLTVTVNGSTVPPLGDGKRAIKDVEISAAALLARAAAPVAGTPQGTPAATAPATPAPRKPGATTTPDAGVPPAFRSAPPESGGDDNATAPRLP